VFPHPAANTGPASPAAASQTLDTPSCNSGRQVTPSAAAANWLAHGSSPAAHSHAMCHGKVVWAPSCRLHSRGPAAAATCTAPTAMPAILECHAVTAAAPAAAVHRRPPCLASASAAVAASAGVSRGYSEPPTPAFSSWCSHLWVGTPTLSSWIKGPTSPHPTTPAAGSRRATCNRWQKHRPLDASR
jgi:hypothetical protein